MNYKDQAEALYRRVERKIGAPPKQKDIVEYLGPAYTGTPTQQSFIDMTLSVRQVSSFTKKDGTVVEGYTQTRVPWNQDEEDKIREAAEKYKDKSTKDQLQYLEQVFRGRHTRQAIAKKRQRLLKD